MPRPSKAICKLFAFCLEYIKSVNKNENRKSKIKYKRRRTAKTVWKSLSLLFNVLVVVVFYFYYVVAAVVVVKVLPALKRQ